MNSIAVVRVELVRERSFEYEGQRVIYCGEDAANILRKYIGNADREMFVVMYLSTKHSVNAIHTVSIGTLDTSLVHPREVFKAAIMSNAACIIVGHNHPSGDPEPSPEDVMVTRRLAEAGKILGIEVMDHIVIGDDGRFVSLRAKGLL
ncbi:MAG: JAB domain-containing protein [Alicyclobacillus sp.]|nr:JAB domain-containing protein [Alicyclobacillus sp.]